MVGDAAGGVYAFDGKSGDERLGRRQGSLMSAWRARDGDPPEAEPRSLRPARTDESLSGVLPKGRSDQAIDAGSGWVENVAWSPDGQVAGGLLLPAGSCVYGADGAAVWRSDDHPSTVSAIAWCSAEELATACYGRVTFFDAPTGEPRQKLEWMGSLVSMVLSPDGDIVACGSQDNSVHFWRRSTEQDSMMEGYPAKPSALAFDDTGTLLATGGGEAVTVWSFEGSGPEGTRPGVLEHHVDTVTTLAFARRGMRLASGSRDGDVVVWSLRRDGQGDPIGAALVADVVGDLYWRPDGRALAALDAQGGVTAWRVGNR